MTNLEYAAGLRAIADLYERHPELVLPYPVIHARADSKDDFIMGAKALADGGIATKSTDADGAYPSIAGHHVKRAFHGVTLDLEIYKSLVCRKVRRMVEMDVWECPDSLLEPEEVVVG